MRLVNQRWHDSILLALQTVCGDHTGVQYSNKGRTYVMNALVKISGSHLPFLLSFLPSVDSVDTVCLFKARLDKFWMYQYGLYDFTADLTRIGDRLVRESS